MSEHAENSFRFLKALFRIFDKQLVLLRGGSSSSRHHQRTFPWLVPDGFFGLHGPLSFL
jgi:hypothetical protein